TVRRWSEDLEQVVEGFINKAEKGLDRVVRFNVDQEMAEWVKIAAKRNGFENVSQYLRFLIDQDRQTQAE
ncbi:MAG: hypothetical protein GWO38_03900, partial [Phycisphaerae bacterium]|nr:hypothetical protein [Phycisphaerae bacterium]NIX26785.1 hypothetical protein [Phycisphaerae bacterium]